MALQANKNSSLWLLSPFNRGRLTRFAYTVRSGRLDTPALAFDNCYGSGDDSCPLCKHSRADSYHVLIECPAIKLLHISETIQKIVHKAVGTEYSVEWWYEDGFLLTDDGFFSIADCTGLPATERLARYLGAIPDGPYKELSLLVSTTIKNNCSSLSKRKLSAKVSKGIKDLVCKIQIASVEHLHRRWLEYCRLTHL
jgi:hypothetical protein